MVLQCRKVNSCRGGESLISFVKRDPGTDVVETIKWLLWLKVRARWRKEAGFQPWNSVALQVVLEQVT